MQTIADKKTIITVLAFLVLNGCASTHTRQLKPTTASNQKPNIQKNHNFTNVAPYEINKTIKNQILAGNTNLKQYKPPYIEKSKYIKILILPFKDADGDLDYGGFLKIKLYDSRLIFEKQKTVKDSNIIGGIN